MENNQLAKFDKLKADVTLYTAPALKLVVVDKDSQAIAMDSARQVIQWKKRVEETRKELIAPLLEAQRQINDYAKSLTEPLVNAESHVKKQLIQWDQKLESDRQAELKRIQEETRKKEEAARKAAAEAQEKIRLENMKAKELADKEAAQKALELKEAEEAAAMFGQAPDLEAKNIAAQEQSTAVFQADSQMNRESLVVEAEADRTINEIAIEAKKEEKAVMANKVSGIKEVWKFEIVELDDVPDDFWVVDEAAIGRVVRSGTRQIPGVRIYSEKTMAVR